MKTLNELKAEHRVCGLNKEESERLIGLLLCECDSLKRQQFGEAADTKLLNFLEQTHCDLFAYGVSSWTCCGKNAQSVREAIHLAKLEIEERVK